MLTLASMFSDGEKLPPEEDGVVSSGSDAVKTSASRAWQIAVRQSIAHTQGFRACRRVTYYHGHPHADPLMLPIGTPGPAPYTFHPRLIRCCGGRCGDGTVRVLRYVIVSDNGT